MGGLKMPKTEKEIIFKTVNKAGEKVNPRWVPAKATNATCPKCDRLMAVISGEVEYDFCSSCSQYFVPEES
jgi:hypothetical protein